jgi:hypothetical protein
MTPSAPESVSMSAGRSRRDLRSNLRIDEDVAPRSDQAADCPTRGVGNELVVPLACGRADRRSLEDRELPAERIVLRRLHDRVANRRKVFRLDPEMVA